MKVSFDVSRARPGAVAGVYPAKCATRTVLDHITSKWGVLILLALQQDSLRWGELRRSIEGISEKMLASTLRTLESDGFVNREAQATIPPRVDYELTARGHELADRLVPLMDWIADNADEITGTPAFPGAKAGESSF
ncbi:MULTISPECIES: helix-turn-helix domain-containing protein [unclassified Cryobacterium]|uniref:winged helix-turn-helix transcriptional regulator n=2 Tax=Bacteria TaxID=2 RepID=UPI002AB50C09|nr:MULTISPECIES: helix-turn-helix domain-containing protein [unclassified Cryobacterium]MDY7529451.1 helix-turn-helix domain-containing protein [Cryobacterium sp. 10C2]MDY7558403.1 helix-turn-helix domain-containing protein [Cryobacterium sp. 10C3]